MSGADKDWTLIRQPRPGARTLWEHPLARGLVDQWNLADTSRASASRNHGLSVVGNITRSTTGAGLGWSGAYQASNNYLSVPRTAAFSYTTQVSFECLVVMNSFQTTGFPYLSGLISQSQSTSGGTNHYGPFLRFNPDATSGKAAVPVFCITQSSGTERRITGAACSVGVPIHLLGTYDGVNLCLYVNGVRTSAARTGSFDNNGSNFISLLSEYVVNSSTLTQNRCADGQMLFARVWNVGKTADEAAKLYRNPWALWDGDDLATFGLPASGNTISVPAGSLTLTGFVPTVSATANQTVAVPAGSLSLTGFAPTVTAADNKTVAVPAGALSLTGFAPTVTATANQSVAVPAGALTLTGFAPTVSSAANQTVGVPAGALSLTGFAPTVSQTANQTVAVDAGTLTLTGYPPTVSGVEVSTTAVAVGGVGRKRRIPHFVEIDGELYEVDDHEHAVEILERLALEKQKKAPVVVKKAVEQKKEPEPPKAVVVAPPEAPKRTVNLVQKLQAQVAATNAQLAEDYRRAAIAEMAMRRHAEEMAEEDDIETLIALGVL